MLVFRSALLGNFPVPRRNREENSLPARSKESDISLAASYKGQQLNRVSLFQGDAGPLFAGDNGFVKFRNQSFRRMSGLARQLDQSRSVGNRFILSV